MKKNEFFLEGTKHQTPGTIKWNFPFNQPNSSSSSRINLAKHINERVINGMQQHNTIHCMKCL